MCVMNEFTMINPSIVPALERASILKIRTTLRRMWARGRLIHAATSLSLICDISIVWFVCEYRKYLDITESLRLAHKNNVEMPKLLYPVENRGERLRTVEGNIKMKISNKCKGKRRTGGIYIHL